MKSMGIKLLFCGFVLVAGEATAETLGNYTGYVQTDTSVIVHTETGSISIIPISPGPIPTSIMKVSLYPDGVVSPRPSQVVVRHATGTAPPVFDHGESLTVFTGSMSLDISKFPVRISYRDPVTGTIISDEAGFRWDDSTRGIRFQMPTNEAFYGMGSRAGSFNHRGERLACYNQPDYCYGEGAQQLNITIPFFISSGNWGMLFDDDWPGAIDFGATDPNILEYVAEGGELSIFLIAGSSVTRVMQTYGLLTGYQPLPPRWALGYVQSRYGYESEQQARDVVTEFRAQQIPLDAIVLDLQWFGRGQMGDFSWDFSAFPNPSGMMSDFAELGVKTICITEPYVVTSSENFSAADANGYFAADEDGESYVLQDFWAGPAGLLDITNPDCRDWWWEFYADRMDEGVTGWWSDLGEPEAHPDDMRHLAGPARAVHNTYSLQWAKLLFERFREEYPDKRLFNLIRSGYAGMQRYSTFSWSGDVQRGFSGLRAQLPIMLGMGMSGVGYMGSDIGGFDCGDLDPELYVRWMQYGCFSPIMRAHGWGVITEPIYFDDTTREIVKNIIELRYQLLPYNYTRAVEYSTSGIPLARPLVYYSDEPSVFDISDEYFWGPDILVAPVLEAGARSRNVYLPEGEWIDYWTDNYYEGSQWIEISAPLEQIPLFVKAGGIIPTAPIVQATEDYHSDTLYIDYYPAPGYTHTYRDVYNDNGIVGGTIPFGPFEYISFETAYSTGDIQLTFPAVEGTYSDAPESRLYEYRIHNIAASPDSVYVVNGQVLPEALSMEEYEQLDTVYYHDAARSMLLVKAAGVQGAFDIHINDPDVDLNGDSPPTIPAAIRLRPAYPNPFNATTRIGFEIPKRQQVTVTVHDVLGRQVAKPANRREFAAGAHELEFDGSGLASGVYFCTLEAGSFVGTQKLVILK